MRSEALAGLKINQLYRVASLEAAIGWDFKRTGAKTICYSFDSSDPEISRWPTTATTLWGIRMIRKGLYKDLAEMGMGREARLLINEARKPFRR